MTNRSLGPLGLVLALLALCVGGLLHAFLDDKGKAMACTPVVVFGICAAFVVWSAVPDVLWILALVALVALAGVAYARRTAASNEDENEDECRAERWKREFKRDEARRARRRRHMEHMEARRARPRRPASTPAPTTPVTGTRDRHSTAAPPG